MGAATAATTTAQREGHFPSTSADAARRPTDPTAAPAQRLFPPPIQRTSFGYRRFLFMGQDSGRLTHDDATVCRNIELFEVDSPNTTDSVGAPLALGTVGLRCIHCIGDRTAASGNANFPRCVAEIGDCLREIAEGHLWRCERAPVSVKQLLKQALTTRTQAKQERGQAWFIQENSRRLLLDYCAYMVRELRLMDRFPINSGIMFQPPEPSAASAAAPAAGQQPQQRQPIPPTLPTPPVPSPSAASPMRRPHNFAESAEHMPFGVMGAPQFGTPQRKDDTLTGTPEPLPLPPRFQHGPSTVRQMQEHQSASYESSMPVNFPFIREPTGHWVCKFCQQIPMQYRDPQFQWAASNKIPPPAHFIDEHLGICRMYQQSLIQDYQGPTASTHGLPFPYPHAAMDPTRAVPMAAAMSGRGMEYEQYPSSPYQPNSGFMSPGSPPSRDLNANTPLSRAMAHLDANDLSSTYTDGSPVPDSLKLVVRDDRLLLTDYYYYLMKQLRQCKFAESDRRTRGGKRDAVELGYGGLQCVHCAKLPNARKFFWGSVDRLANSFAEIPTHILKCRACPKETQDALLTLKEKHAEQMSRLPRGSQKVYFRRMWRRVHEQDKAPASASPPAQQQQQPPRPPPLQPQGELVAAEATNSPPAAEPSPPERLHPFTTQKMTAAIHHSPGGGTSGSDESVILIERSPVEAAKALADSAIQAGPPSPSSRVLLAIPNDREWLSDTDIFVRQQVEVFCATREDVDAARADNKFPIDEGTVGLRCVHCAMSKHESSEHSTFYPFSVNGLYEAVREFHRLHLDHCKNAPAPVRSKLAALKGYASLSSVGRGYYVTAAKSLGLVDTKNGIRASGESVPLSSRAAFTFSEPDIGLPSGPTQAQTPDAQQGGGLTPRKRAHSDTSSPSGESKRMAHQSVAFGGDIASQYTNPEESLLQRTAATPDRADQTETETKQNPPHDPSGASQD